MTESATKNHRILLVEDETHLAIGIKYNLEAEGYLVEVAGDGPTALAKLADTELAFDLVILDLMLPGMSGYAVCGSLRGDGNDVPVLMLSARTLAEDRIRGYDVGADSYLHKPFDLDELLAMARGLISRRARRESTASKKGVAEVYEFGRVRVNFGTFEVTVAGQEMKLTHLDMKLLRYLIENEGLVVSRSELLERVWEQPGSISTRTVDNYLLRLRKYFEIDPAEPRHFLSVRGAGYRFVALGEGPSPADSEAPSA